MPDSGSAGPFWRRIRFGGPDDGAELDEEVRFHLEMSETELRAAGWNEAEAKAEARRRFGQVGRWKGECRKVHRRRDGRLRRRGFLVGLGLDLRQAWRQVARNPGFALAAVLTLGLGIGLTTAIFSLVDGILLRPLPYDDPDRLVEVFAANEERGWSRWGVSAHDAADWAERGAHFESLAIYRNFAANSMAGGRAFRVQIIDTWHELFSILRASPHMGRFFDADDELGDRVVVLSHRFWQRDLGADPDVLGSSLELDGASWTVIGVAGAGLEYPSAGVDVFRPLPRNPDHVGLRGQRYLGAIARLRTQADGSTSAASLAGAQNALDALSLRLAEEHPDSNEGWRAEIVPLHESEVGGVRRTLLLLWAAVGFLLLIACSNVAHLMLVRGEARRLELATRAALGAGRARLLRQLFTESVLIAVLGGVVGVALAYGVVHALPLLAAGSLPRLDGVGVDGAALLFAVAVSLATGLFFGAVPAWRGGRLGSRATGEVLHGVRSEGGGRSGRLTAGLVIGEIVLASVLLVAAGLVVRSFVTLLDQDPGFDPDGVVAFRLAPAMDFSFMSAGDQDAIRDGYRAQRNRVADRFDEIFTRLRALPGIESVAATNVLPMSGEQWADDVHVPGTGEPAAAYVRVVTPGYFEVLGIQRAAGRTIEQNDADGTAVINRSAAERFWPGVSADEAVGRTIRVGAPGEPAYDQELRILGVVGDVRLRLETPAAPLVYVPMRGATGGFAGTWALSVVVRAADGVAAHSLFEPSRTAVAEVAPELPLYDVATLESRRLRGATDERLVSWVLGVFAAAALGLAALGLYGLMAYSVRRGRHGIGVRLALGATQGDIVGHWLRRGLGLAVTGLGLGLLAALAVGPSLASLLYGIGPRDPWTFVAAAVTLGGAALAASIVPARRAARLDPARVLGAD